jgi:hypothetical protein
MIEIDGKAARHNNGKPPLELVPGQVIAKLSALEGRAPELVEALRLWGDFQMGGTRTALLEALLSLAGSEDLWEQCALVFDYGRCKYADWNWLRGQPWSMPIGSGLRHLLALQRGETTDPESGLSHLGHVACNAVMLLWFIDAYPEGDDRPRRAGG